MKTIQKELEEDSQINEIINEWANLKQSETKTKKQQEIMRNDLLEILYQKTEEILVNDEELIFFINKYVIYFTRRFPKKFSKIKIYPIKLSPFTVQPKSIINEE